MRKVVIASPMATQSGYGHHAREIITNIIEAIINIKAYHDREASC